ncbi:protein of unknown function [Kyrpidia spormannii]|uniref:Uncharacterized protein n=2 Tax=Kyrpidia spormannii TaxID=2055160 RepID=A0ACA8Z560_9BACL|nr:protein of unknown function [Kyrpidia spormannii]CAB3390392.1 protein of unknown function [Kyrpidia spormannii]
MNRLLAALRPNDYDKPDTPGSRSDHASIFNYTGRTGVREKRGERNGEGVPKDVGTELLGDGADRGAGRGRGLTR